MATPYVPDRGDLVWIDFDPQAGREQAKRRPAAVLSPKAYNGRVGLMLCVPVTSQVKGYPFEVAVAGPGKPGVALADQVKSFDWISRRAEKAGRLTGGELAAILKKLRLLLA